MTEKTHHGTHFLHKMHNVSHDVVYRGGLGGCEGMEVCDWSNACNLPLAVTSAVKYYLYGRFCVCPKMLAVPSLMALLVIDSCTNTFFNYTINIPILMFCFCNKMPYTSMSILTPRHLVGGNHGKRDSTF